MIIDDKDLRTIKVEFPLGEETDVYITFNGKRPGAKEFTLLRGVINLVESSMVPKEPRTAGAVIDPEKPPTVTSKKGHNKTPHKNRIRWAMVIEEFKKDPAYPNVSVQGLAKRLNLPFSSVRWILERSKLLKVREEAIEKAEQKIEEAVKADPNKFETPMD